MEKVRAQTSRALEWLDYRLGTEYLRESSKRDRLEVTQSSGIGKLCSISVYFLKDNDSSQMRRFLLPQKPYNSVLTLDLNLQKKIGAK